MKPNRSASFCTFLLALALIALLPACSGKDAPKDPAKKTASKTSTASTGVDSAGDTSQLTGEAAAFADPDAVADTVSTFSLLLHPKAGGVYRYRVTQNSSTQMDVIKAQESVVYNFSLKVTDVNSDGSIAVEMRYDSVRIKRVIPPGPLDSNGATVNYDSRQNADAKVPGSENYRALIGQNVKITISKEGDVTDISNIEPIVSKIIEKVRDSIPAAMMEQARMQVRLGVKMQAFQSILLQLFLHNPPDSSVRAGASWSRRDSVAMMGVPTRTTLTYRFADAKKLDEKSLGRVVVSLATSFPKKSIDNENVSATITSADLHGGGEYIFDLTSGMPVRKTTSLELSMQLEGEAKVGPNKGKKTSLTQKQSTRTIVELTGYAPSEQ